MDWLFANVEGFQDRREARKYASKLLKVIPFIHTSYQLYYVKFCIKCEPIKRRNACFHNIHEAMFYSEEPKKPQSHQF